MDRRPFTIFMEYPMALGTYTSFRASTSSRLQRVQHGLAWILALLLITVLAAPSADAASSERPGKKQIKSIEKNISSNLAHKSEEVRSGTMELLIDMRRSWPELDLEFAVTPLLDVLKDDASAECRMLAATALFLLDSGRGRVAIAHRAEFDASEQVRKHCEAVGSAWNDRTAVPSEAVRAQ